MLPDSEALLPLLGKEVRDGAAGLCLHLVVHIGQGPAQPVRQDLTHCGLAAARHPDKQQILCLPLHLPGDLLHPVVRDRPVQEALRRGLGLGHQHPQPIGTQQAPVLRIQQKLGSGRVIDQIEYAFAGGKPIQIHRGYPSVGVHPHGVALTMSCASAWRSRFS